MSKIEDGVETVVEFFEGFYKVTIKQRGKVSTEAIRYDIEDVTIPTLIDMYKICGLSIEEEK
ncbi:MAG: hypothetical protein WC998_00850 [Candidatus Paceibacterota bacterium]